MFFNGKINCGQKGLCAQCKVTFHIKSNSTVSLSHVNAAGDCPGQTRSQQQQNVQNIRTSSGIWVEQQEAGHDV